MPYFIKNIGGQVFDNLETTINLSSNIRAEYGMGNYITLHGYVGFLQDFSQVVSVELIPNRSTYGLAGSKNIIEIEISY